MLDRRVRMYAMEDSLYRILLYMMEYTLRQNAIFIFPYIPDPIRVRVQYDHFPHIRVYSYQYGTFNLLHSCAVKGRCGDI